jgi:hypothetical protein
MADGPTVIAYLPAFSDFTGLPAALDRAIVKPGPTAPLSGVGLAIDAGATASAAPSARAATAERMTTSLGSN